MLQKNQTLIVAIYKVIQEQSALELHSWNRVLWEKSFWNKGKANFLDNVSDKNGSVKL